jgi:hypothetical protein
MSLEATILKQLDYGNLCESAENRLFLRSVLFTMGGEHPLQEEGPVKAGPFYVLQESIHPK